MIRRTLTPWTLLMAVLAACPPSGLVPQPGEYLFQGGVATHSGSPVGLNQTVLVIYVRASDDVTPNLANLRTSEQAEFTNVSGFYNESSFNQLSFNYTHAPNAGWYQLPQTYDAYIWTPADIAAAPVGSPQRQQAQDQQGLLQDFSGFFTNSLQAAQNDGFNVGSFSQVVVVIIGPFFRGTSYSPANFTLTNTGGNAFQVTLPTIVVSTNMAWSRTAHEFGHAFGGFADLYNAANRRIGNWDIMDCTDCGNQTTGWHKDKRAQWFQGTQMKTLVRPSGINRVDDVTLLTPYETQTPAPNAVQSLRLDVGGGLHLYVENRQVIAGQTGSQNLPANAVIITDGDDNADQVNSSRPPILLFGGPVTSGNAFTDQSYGNLKLAVSGAPPNLQVTTGWGPDPYFDLRITPWAPPPWESVDIWIDSPVNAWDTYEFSDAVANPNVAGNPVRNGDRPRTGRANRVYARVTNDGNVAAANVRVSFFVSTPPGIGDTGNWTLVDRTTIPNIPAGGTALAQVLWTPQASTHTCLKAQIDVQPGELNANNNLAQENVGDFNTTSASPWKPIAADLQVANPTKIHQTLRLELSNLPQGWTGWVSKRFIPLAPGEVKRVQYRIDPGTGGKYEIGSRIDVNAVGWIVSGDHEIAIGGVTSAVHLVHSSSVGTRIPEAISLARIDSLVIPVTIAPAQASLPVALDISQLGGTTYSIVSARTGANGQAQFRVGDLIRRGELPRLEIGRKYIFRVDLYGSAAVDSGTSGEVTVEIRP